MLSQTFFNCRCSVPLSSLLLLPPSSSPFSLKQKNGFSECGPCSWAMQLRPRHHRYQTVVSLGFTPPTLYQQAAAIIRSCLADSEVQPCQAHPQTCSFFSYEGLNGLWLHVDLDSCKFSTERVDMEHYRSHLVRMVTSEGRQLLPYFFPLEFGPIEDTCLWTGWDGYMIDLEAVWEIVEEWNLHPDS